MPERRNICFWQEHGVRGGHTGYSKHIIFGVAHIRKSNGVIHDGRLDHITMGGSVILETEIN